MAIAQNLIADEKIVFSSKKAWIAPVRDSVIPLLLLIGAWLINAVSPDKEGGVFGFVGNLLDLFRTGLIIVAVVWFIYNIIVWRTAEFAVTNLRVIREEGFISRRSSATLLSAVSDVQSKVGILGKSLKYGDLTIYTQSGEAGADRFKSITDPEAFRNAIMTKKMADARDLTARPATAPAAVTMAAPATAPADPAPAQDPAQTLAQLADLRDRGAITPAEYDAKKAEILARM